MSNTALLPVKLDFDFWCHTELGRTEATYLWTIHNFRFVLAMRVGEKLKSSRFNVSTADLNSEWQMLFYQKTSDNKNRPMVMIYYEGNLKSRNCDLFILNKDGKRVDMKSFGEYEDGNNYWKYTLDRNIFIAKTDEILTNDKFTFCCDITVYNSDNLSAEKCRCDLQAEHNLSEDMRSLFNSKELSDFTIVVKEEEFLAHKAVLAARSSVFAAMFRTSMQENNENRVNIDDITPGAFNIVLEFMYTGSTSNVKDSPELQNIFYAASKYDIDYLKKLSENELCKKISVENVVEIIILANRHQAKHLKEEALRYFFVHSPEVTETEGWNVLLQEPEILTEIFRTTSATRIFFKD